MDLIAIRRKLSISVAILLIAAAGGYWLWRSTAYSRLGKLQVELKEQKALIDEIQPKLAAVTEEAYKNQKKITEARVRFNELRAKIPRGKSNKKLEELWAEVGREADLYKEKIVRFREINERARLEIRLYNEKVALADKYAKRVRKESGYKKITLPDQGKVGVPINGT